MTPSPAPARLPEDRRHRVAPPSPPRSRMIGLLAFGLPLALYLSFPSSLWNFDGVACAAALELGNPVFFFHANHLLYGAIGYLFWKIFLHPLGLVRALPALQLFTSLLSAGGLVGLFGLLRRLTRQPLLSLGITLLMSVTAGFWCWSVEAQVYAFGFIGLAWATYFLFSDESPRKYLWVGLWHAAAILGHLMHLLWFIPACFWISREPLSAGASRSKNLRLYLTGMLPSFLLPYAAVLGLVMGPAHPDAQRIFIWLKGSAGLTPGRHWAWHTAGWTAPFQWARTTIDFFWGTFHPYGVFPPGSALWVLTVLSMVGLTGLFVRSFSSKARLARQFSLLWILVYGLFLWTWEPATLPYRMTESIPFAILFALGLQTIGKQTWVYGLAASLLAATLIVNFATRIHPMSRPELNPLYMQTMELSKMTPDQSLYLTGGGTCWIYLLYFTGRTAWNINHLQSARLSEEVRRQRAQRPVFIQTDLIHNEGVQTWITNFKLQPVHPDLPWQKLM